jgi:hypothetical protein
MHGLDERRQEPPQRRHPFFLLLPPACRGGVIGFSAWVDRSID